jgi:autotransporter translocation and assembly factor TamB
VLVVWVIKLDFISKAKWAFFSISLFIVIILGSLTYFITGTQAGTQLALKALPYVSSYAITYDRVSGTLSSSSLNFDGIHFQSPDFDLYAKNVTINISFLQLLSKKIDIQTLHIDTPSVIRSKQSVTFDQTIKELINKIEKSDSLSWKSLISEYHGYDFFIQNLNINHLHFVSGKQNYDIEQLVLTNLNSENTQIFSTLKIIMPEIKVEIDLSGVPHIVWDIQIKNLNNYVAALKGDLSSKGHWKSEKNNHLKLTLTSKQLLIDNLSVMQLKLMFDGNLNQHILLVAFNQKEKKFLTEIQGNLEKTGLNTTWHGQINKCVYAHPKFKNSQPTLAKFKLIFSPERSILTSKFNLWGNNQFTLDASISHKKPFNLNGKIHADIQDLKLLSLLTDLEKSNDLRLLQGKGVLNLSLDGTLAQPKITGDLVFNKVTSKIPKLNTLITLEQIGFYDLGSPKIAIKANGKMGTGDFQLEGYAKRDKISPEIKLSLKGSHLQISNTAEYKVFASPNLVLSIDKNAALLSGQLYVPEARITPQDNSEGISVSEDIILVKNHRRLSAHSESAQTLKKLKTNIEVIFGENIFFEGYGLTTQAKGRVIIESRQDDTSKATGKIALINGRYGAFGHYFSLSQGQLIFQSDPILDPKIDIRAERTIKPNMRIKNNASGRNDVIVGMQLIGRLSKLQTKLYSNPHFSDREIISYLILGHGQNENTGADGEVLLEAVKQLTTAFYPKSKRLTEKKSFYDRLKLDWSIGHSPFDDETTDQLSDFESKYVNVGKRISDKLYIQYSLGLADKISVYSIQYLLGNHLVLEAKTDSQSRTAADLLFTFESG